MTELAQIYGMTGFYRNEGEEEKVPFGGYFEHDFYTGFINGERVDALYGRALLAGKLDRDLTELKFVLQYSGRRDEIYYNYKKQGHIWVGQFKTSDKGNSVSSGSGSSICDIRLFRPLPKTLESRGLEFPIFWF